MPGTTRCWLASPLRRTRLRTKSRVSSYSSPGCGARDLSGRAPFSTHPNPATNVRPRRGVHAKRWVHIELKAQNQQS
ncbi:guanine nucleotide binding protein (G protein), gamma 7, transcript variant X1 [Columba livia]|uniref:Guanine nucleotide binding protein (G protein), gamma 7, transcript variant X1 n=1 Tax=Columba livia TaxID=8932 RepID=A0A2I0LKC5_COLLI|nr:guanine nucleotide binding protein (G protein), gamma 7, transcript variant X1 [Columba livia]